jgi:hypothetical protein
MKEAGEMRLDDGEVAVQAHGIETPTKQNINIKVITTLHILTDGRWTPLVNERDTVLVLC